MPSASQLSTHSPASDRELTFMFMWMWATAAADDSLIPGMPPPPAESFYLCELTDRDQTEERWVRTLWVRSGFWALSKDLSRPFRSHGVSHVLHCCWSVWIMNPSIFHICVHTTGTRLTFCLVHPTLLNFSFVIHPGNRGFQSIAFDVARNR